MADNVLFSPPATPMLTDFGLLEMSDVEFGLYQVWIEQLIGIHLAPIKKVMLSGRLAKRLRERGIASYGEYFRLITGETERDERQIAIDLITTNETYFFREPKHFDALRERILPALANQQTVRVWSAASASGEEAYSVAMLLAAELGEAAPWEVLGSDISQRVLTSARRALYPMERAHHIPTDYLKRYCLRGTGDYMGHFLIDKVLRQRVRFLSVNLIEPLPELGLFDVVFLRNVIIYFDAETKRRVVKAVTEKIRPGGWLVVGHSESLIGLPTKLEPVLPTLYRKLP